MIDPRKTLVLVQTSGSREDKTADIASLDIDGSQIDVRFARGKKTYKYGSDRIRVLKSPKTVPVPDGARLLIRGTPWHKGTASAVEVREFGDPLDVWRRVSYRSGQRERHESHPADYVEIVPDSSRKGLAKEVIAYWRGDHLLANDRLQPGDRPVSCGGSSGSPTAAEKLCLAGVMKDRRKRW